ncbi:MAG: glucans biosynthesis glucosyltransferase MdoH [Rubrivivax sp.]
MNLSEPTAEAVRSALQQVPHGVQRTAPPINRQPMPAAPWFGLLRGLLFAMWPGMHFNATHDASLPWQRSAGRRRRTLLALVSLLASLAVALQWQAAPDEISTAWLVQATLVTLLFAWVGAGFVTALLGAWVMLRGDRHALVLRQPHAPIDAGARTAVIMPICNEDVATVFAGLSATAESLAATGALSLFDIYVLSDTADPALRAAELQAWQRLRDTLGDNPIGGGARVFYRHRKVRRRRKAGNVADFCRRWGHNYRYMVVLDADSIMHGDALVAMVRLMEQNPRTGLVQTLPQGFGHGTAHARLQQFGNRVTGRLFALGMAYWQLGESHYWGHNAILRVAPFMQHCALAPLPGRGGLSGEIMSHDFVEAALMRRAGHEVWLVPDLQGSWEQHPANLLEELQRDRRWCQGNLQNARLMAEPGLRPVHRVMLATGALSYLMAPVWLTFVALGLWLNTATASSPALWGLTLLLLLMPRVLGVLAVRLNREQAAFGGSARLVGSAVLELLMSALQAPLRMLAHTAFVLGALTGLRLDWKSPAREAAAVAWGDALRRVGTLAFAALALALLALASHGHLFELPAPYLAPLLLPLLLAVPFTVFTGGPGLGRGLQKLGLLSVPEERRVPPTLARGAQRQAFVDLLPPPRVASVIAQPRRVSVFGQMVMATATAALTAMVILPRTAATPEVSPAVRAGQEVLALVASLSAQAEQAAAPTTAVRSSRPRAVARVLPHRPAQMIDDAVRQRAYLAVAQALETS